MSDPWPLRLDLMITYHSGQLEPASNGVPISRTGAYYLNESGRNH